MFFAGAQKIGGCEPWQRLRAYVAFGSDCRFRIRWIVIGAGFPGLYQLHKLRDEPRTESQSARASIRNWRHVVLESLSQARCDSGANTLLLVQQEGEIEQGWEWSERYPEHGEINAKHFFYFFFDKLGLKSDIQLNT